MNELCEYQNARCKDKNYIFFDMFRTTKCSSWGGLYKQIYGILSRIYINSLVTRRMCFILSCVHESYVSCNLSQLSLLQQWGSDSLNSTHVDVFHSRPKPRSSISNFQSYISLPCTRRLVSCIWYPSVAVQASFLALSYVVTPVVKSVP